MMQRVFALALAASFVITPAALANDSYNSSLQLSSPTNQQTYGSYNNYNNTYASGYNNYNQAPQQQDTLRARVSAIPQGTIMMMRLNQPLNSASTRIGDAVSGVLEADVYLDNQIALPQGSTVEGQISSVTSAGRVGRPGKMEMQFSVIRTPYGNTVPIQAHVVTSDSTGVLKGDSDQAMVLKGLGIAAGGTAAGTLLGTATGGIFGAAGAGATLGLAAGAAGGIGYALMRQGKQVEIPSGARMSIVLDQPVALN